jgi:hypothetical protein
MPHGHLRGPRGNAALAQQRAERGLQRVNVKTPAAVVALVDCPLPVHQHPTRDAGRNKVAVEDSDQPPW